jgi:hypothetical protein
MSYCRFSDGDVYMYPSVEGVTCCACRLQSSSETIYMETKEEALEHLILHQERGDSVPQYAFERLMEETIEKLIETTKKQE